MFYTLSKVLWFLIAPSNLLFLLAALGVMLLYMRFARAGRVFVTLAVLGFGVLGLSPAGHWLIMPLEERFPAPEVVAAPDGIVVLGGSFDTHVSAIRDTVELNEAGERLTEVLRLAHRYPDARIVFSGGGEPLVFAASNEASLARTLFDGTGIDPARVTFESRSRNTAENAAFSYADIDPSDEDTWLLVTSAFHVPRAMGSFRAAGWENIIPYPVDFRTRGSRDIYRPFASLGQGLRRVDLAAKEYVGMVAYRMTGRTDALFPGP